MSVANILFVDDSSLIRKLISEILASWGYVVDLAEDGKEGLERAMDPRSQFTLIITDLQMPNMSGIRLLQELRRAKNETPVILLSSLLGDDPSVYRELEAQGFAAVMKKDFDQDALRTGIRNIVGS